jgi:hypothetical protein
MRRLTSLLLCSAMLTALLGTAPASADAPVWPATFRGLTEPQFLPIEIGVDERRDGSLGLRYVYLAADLTCPSGDQVGWGFGIGWSRSLPLEGRVATIDQVDGNLAVHLRLRVTPNRVRGSISMAMAAFDRDEALMRCDSGAQRFVAERVPETAARAARVARDVEVRLMDHGDGRITVRHREPAARDDGHRWYSGGFSRRMPTEFSVVRRGADRPLVDNLAFVTDVACPDGGSFGRWMFFISWFGGGIDVRDHRARLDDVQFDMALHWRARIAPEHARGMLDLGVPAFTPNEELMRCGTVDQDWTATHVARPEVF